MKTVEDAEQRWGLFTARYSDFKSLTKAAKVPGKDSPTNSTLRSICWKAFLLFGDTKDIVDWPQILQHLRGTYAGYQSQYLRYIRYPEQLDSALDPLADEADNGTDIAHKSPWITLRKDEELRAEIQQDVERCMQDEEWFRRQTTQEMMVDILFVFCKINDDISYRQGMHELLAPLLWVVQHDAVNIKSSARNGKEIDQLEMLNAEYVEHDAYSLFSKVMETAKSSYEQGNQPRQSTSNLTTELSIPTVEPPIVERSKYVHEDLLNQVDPDLATHLTAVEILPQIFLIRWVRLLFGREFQFTKLLDLWDVLFAEGLTSDLVDLVCIAMLLRIRWELLDADYSTALALLLHYPEGSSEVSPASFVRDAVFLRTHLTIEGGSRIVAQHTHRSPILKEHSQAQPSRFQPVDKTSVVRTRRLPSPRQGPSAARISAGIDELVQGAAKGVLSRSEKWGWNKVVRDAVGEVRKNVQGLQSGNSSWNRVGPRWSLDEGRFLVAEPKENLDKVKRILHRNEDLAQILASVTLDLKEAVDGRKLNSLSDAAILAISKLNLVRICLEDSTIPIQFESTAVETYDKGTKEKPDDLQEDEHRPPPVSDAPIPEKSASSQTDALVSEPEHKPAIELRRGSPPLMDQPRSSIAKSSFAWMLGEEDTTALGFKASPFTKSPSTRGGDPKGSEGSGLLFGSSDEPSRGDRSRKKGTKGVEDLLMGDL